MLMRLCLFSIVYAEGIPYQSFTTEIVIQDVKTNFVDKETLRQIYYKYNESRTPENYLELCRIRKLLLDNNYIKRAMEYAKISEKQPLDLPILEKLKTETEVCANLKPPTESLLIDVQGQKSTINKHHLDLGPDDPNK